MSATSARGADGRAAFKRKFSTPEEQSEHFRDLAHRAHERRITLSSDEVAALGQAYSLLDRIYRRHAAKLERAAEQEAAG